MAKKPRLTVVNPDTDPDSAGPNPPRKLGQPGLSLWHRIQDEFGIDDSGGIELLMQVCAAVDRLEAISARINTDGELVRSRAGARLHPLIRAETQLRAFVVRTLGKLGIVQEQLKGIGRPGRPSGWTP